MAEFDIANSFPRQDILERRGNHGCRPSTFLVSLDTSGQTGGFNPAVSDDGHLVAYETTIAGVTQILLAATGF